VNNVRKPDLHIFDEPEALFAGAAALVARQAAAAVSARGRFLLAISGGSTPLPLFRRLASTPYREELPWSQTHIFWADERLVPPEDEASNYGQAWSVWLSHVPLPPENIHRVDSALDPAAAAGDYANELRALAGPPPGPAWPRFDLVLLGLGADGHTASLFPGSPGATSTEAPVVPVWAEYGDRPAARVTLTPPVFNSARHILFLVQGKDKAPAVAQTIARDGDPHQLPALRIWPDQGQLSWFVDREAASLLPD
jgi:6-phosphogluconolactonase